MYYTQENLLELRSRQIAENRIFDKVEAFDQVCLNKRNIQTTIPQKDMKQDDHVPFYPLHFFLGLR